MRKSHIIHVLTVAAALASTPGVAPVAAAAETQQPSTNRSKEMSNVNERVATYIAVWNERDAKRRRELVARTWTETGRYVDAHRHAEGHAAIDAMIEAAQQQFPGYRLRLVSGVEAHNGNLRFSWAAGGSDEAPLYLGGTDFVATAADGRFQSVIGFVDAAPAH